MDYSPLQAGAWLKWKFSSDQPKCGFKPVSDDPQADFDLWISYQTKFSFESILKNIGGVGLKSDEVAVGAVIASPSRAKPDYFYQWVRDAAITIQSLVEYLDDHQFNQGQYELVSAIESYILNSHKLQRLDNLSGSWESLDGLGEPKFLTNSTQFNEHWGRPQRDGPALRVITISDYLKILEKYDQAISLPDLKSTQWVYDNIIKYDLMYIITSWYKNGFDLWEEIDSIHLFTALTQLKALKNGINLVNSLVIEEDLDFQTKLKEAFQALRLFILFSSGFKIEEIPYLIETPSLLVQGKRSGLDIASILGSLRAHDVTSVDDSVEIPFPVNDSSVFSTLIALVNDMKYRYPLNHKYLKTVSGVALGRYPEDIYDGLGTSEGNPWFIATATAGELVYKIVYQIYSISGNYHFTNDQVSLINELSRIEDLTQNDHGVFVVEFGTESFNLITDSLLKYADSFIDIIRGHIDDEGRMSEQFDKYSGFMTGAEDLTWSYGSLWSALRWREKVSKLINTNRTS